MDSLTPDYVYHTSLGFYRVMDASEDGDFISATVTNGQKTECWVYRVDDTSQVGVVVYLNRPPMRRKAARRIRRRTNE